MSAVTGVIAVKAGHGGGIKIEGYDPWFNAKPEVLLNFSKGMVVTIDETDGKISTISAAAGATAPAPAATTESKPATLAYDARQSVIIYQSSRANAVAAVNGLLSSGAISLPATKNAQMGAYLSLVNTVNNKFYEDAMQVFNTGVLPEDE